MRSSPISKRKDAISWPRWIPEFLRNLVIYEGNVSKAIHLSPKSRTTIYDARSRDQEFSKCWDSIVAFFEKPRRDMA